MYRDLYFSVSPIILLIESTDLMIQCNLDYPDHFVHRPIAAIPDKGNVRITKMPMFLAWYMTLAYKRYLYSMIMASSVQESTLDSQFWPRQACGVHSSVTTPTKDHQSCLLCMQGNVFSGLRPVRIIEVPDKLGPDNRDCTVLLVKILTHVSSNSSTSFDGSLS
jgi:hypothetical protein